MDGLALGRGVCVERLQVVGRRGFVRRHAGGFESHHAVGQQRSQARVWQEWR